MNKQSIATASLCVMLSILINLFFSRDRHNTKSTTVLRGSAFHLVDPQGRVRAKLEFLGDSPNLTMLNEAGNEVVGLGIGGFGEGSLSFSSTAQGYERQGVVVLGYLPGSDTSAPTDPLGAWGLGVKLNPNRSVGVGLTKTGRAIGVPATPAK